MFYLFPPISWELAKPNTFQIFEGKLKMMPEPCNCPEHLRIFEKVHKEPDYKLMADLRVEIKTFSSRKMDCCCNSIHEAFWLVGGSKQTAVTSLHQIGQ